MYVDAPWPTTDGLYTDREATSRPMEGRHESNAYGRAYEYCYSTKERTLEVTRLVFANLSLL